MPVKCDEKLLVARCLDGEAAAQKQLFELLARRLMGVSRRYARDNQEAEDILQDGFIRIFTYLDSFHFDGPLEAWARRIVVNVALRKIKKKSYTHEKVGIPEYMDQSVESDVLSRLSQEEIMAHVNTLPFGYKTVFNLYVVEGYSHREISKLLDCGESTSRSQLVKAKKMLQKLILSTQKIAV